MMALDEELESMGKVANFFLIAIKTKFANAATAKII